MCTLCGGEHPKWQGQCADCGAWNTLGEVALAPASRAGPRPAGWSGEDSAKVTPLSAVSADETARVSTGIGELDRVLGGGLVPGS
ncbi:MAG TPA: DNA repair protein RadA, partial [Planctomycetaceae bacterium]|nr:DNA repair protein RadA [Planctomycetaceae bacterium]